MIFASDLRSSLLLVISITLVFSFGIAGYPILVQAQVPSNSNSTNSTTSSTPVNSPYKFERGYPAAGTAERAYDDADLGRAIEAYKFFYPTVSTEGLMQATPSSDKPNQVGIKMAGENKDGLFENFWIYITAFILS